jgi:hypothetical protein
MLHQNQGPGLPLEDPEPRLVLISAYSSGLGLHVHPRGARFQAHHTTFAITCRLRLKAYPSTRLAPVDSGAKFIHLLTKASSQPPPKDFMPPHESHQSANPESLDRLTRERLTQT